MNNVTWVSDVVHDLPDQRTAVLGDHDLGVDRPLSVGEGPRVHLAVVLLLGVAHVEPLALRGVVCSARTTRSQGMTRRRGGKMMMMMMVVVVVVVMMVID